MTSVDYEVITYIVLIFGSLIIINIGVLIYLIMEVLK